MNQPSTPLTTASDNTPTPALVTAQEPKAWVADFVPISHSDPALRAVLQQLQWALENEDQN